MKITISNGRLVDVAAGLDRVGHLHVDGGRVVAIDALPSGFVAERVIDASGLVVCPGLIDLSARLREPGFEYKATLESEMQAALAGGVTSLVCPPDTDPVLDEPGLVEMLKHRARSLDQAHLYPLGALTVGLKGEVLTERASSESIGTTLRSAAVLLALRPKGSEALTPSTWMLLKRLLMPLTEMARSCGSRL
jgi:dihydroorotase